MRSYHCVMRTCVNRIGGSLLFVLLVAFQTIGLPATVEAVPLPVDGSLVAIARGDFGGQELVVWDEPSLDSQPLATLRAGKETAGAPVVLVLERRDDGWMRVLTPIRPRFPSSGPVDGWIRDQDVRLNRTHYTVDVNLGARRIVVAWNGRTVRSMPAAIGRPATPTPSAATYITGLTKTPFPGDDPRGPFTLELADWSAAIPDYSINGRSSSIVIQGTNCADSCLGRAVSSGSLRVRNTDIVWMAITLPVGTPVSIH